MVVAVQELPLLVSIFIFLFDMSLTYTAPEVASVARKTAV
jgi:hypothetical protein